MPLVPVFCQKSAAVRWSDDPGARGGERHLARVLLHVVDELGHGVGGEVGARHERVGRAHRHRQKVVVLERVVSQVLVEHRVDREDPDGAHEERVAVGLRRGHELAAEAAVRARLVIDHEALAERLLQLGRDGARGDVRGAAGRERDHDGDRPGGVLLGGGGLGEDDRADDGEREVLGDLHGFSSLGGTGRAPA